MKKIVVFITIFLCSVGAPCCAEIVSADHVSVSVMRRWLSEYYACKVDDDGDLVISRNDTAKILIKIIRKAKLVRIYARFNPYKKCSFAEMIILANKFNATKRFLRISIDQDSSSTCDYYIVYDGGLDSRNLLEAVKWFYSLEEDWCDYVINKGSK